MQFGDFERDEKSTKKLETVDKKSKKLWYHNVALVKVKAKLERES